MFLYYQPTKKNKVQLFQVLIFSTKKCKPACQDHAHSDCAWTTCHVPQPQLNARDVPFLTRMVEDKQHRYKTKVFYQDGNQLHCKAMEMAVNVFATCTEVYVTEWFSDKHAHLQMRCRQNKRVITAVTTAQVRDKSCV